MADALVPVIDIAPFLAGAVEDKARVAAELDAACRDIGFLVIAGHSVPESQTAEMQRVTRAFFDLSYWEKLRIKMPPDRYRGYAPPSTENLALTLDEEIRRI